MAFEELLSQVGGMGKFQIFQFFITLPSHMVVVAHILLENFTGAIPGHRCWVPILDNNTFSDNDTGILSQDALLRISIPLDSNMKPENCRRFIHPQWQLLHLNGSIPNTSEPDMEPCVDGWVYDRSSFSSTIVTEWDLVCDYRLLKSAAQFIFMTGMLVGGLIYGYLSDRFGRKLVLLCSYLQMSICETSTAFAPTFSIYCSLRFLAGFSSTVLLSNACILALEWIRTQSKPMVIVLTTCALSVGQIILGGLAFVFREWRTLQLVLSVPLFAFFLFSRWQVESARWLIITNKPDKSLKALKKVAHINGMKNAEGTLNIEVVRSIMQKELDAARTKTNMWDFFSTPNMRKRTCLISFMRFANAVSFYGITLNLQHLGSNIFLLQVLFGVLTLSARFLALFAMTYMSRRVSEMLFMLLAGLSILVNTYVPQEMQTVRTVLASVGITFTAAASAIITLHFVELFPTCLLRIVIYSPRGKAAGLEFLASRTGGALAPLLMALTIYFTTLPWIIYGVFPIIAGLSVFFLPETKDLPLIDTIQDVENE
ncbi:solute carrier family 22 member 10 [Tupaia chinensis]|uniref:solute carrier family 22 member 10 n=1 Tax=Tupaia chinensis TaxID=246437 RepID=UPI0003C90739|nr:solute carrier family 22 member 10 [Tupaia chinensis]